MSPRDRAAHPAAQGEDRDTSSLEELIRQVRAIPGVARTETMVVLSTHTERAPAAARIAARGVPAAGQPRRRAGRNGGERNKVLAIKPASSDG